MVLRADAMPQMAQRTVVVFWFWGGVMAMARLGKEEVCHVFVVVGAVKSWRARSRRAKMLVMVQAVGGRRVPFQVGEAAKSWMLAFRGVDALGIVCGEDSRGVELVRGVAVVSLRM